MRILLTIGFLIESDYLNKIKELTESEPSLIINGEVKASVWDEEGQQEIESVIEQMEEFDRELEDDAFKATSFEIKMGTEVFESLLVPILIQGEILEGSNYLIQVSKDEAMMVYFNVQRIMFIVGVFTVLAGLWVSIRISRKITKPIKTLAVVAGAISKGDLTKDVEIERNDEVGLLANAFKEMAHRLRDLILQVRENTMAVTDVSQQLNQTSHSFSKEVKKQEVATDDTSSSIIQMGASIKGVN